MTNQALSQSDKMTTSVEHERLPRKRGGRPLPSFISFVVGASLLVFLLTTSGLGKIIANFRNATLLYILLSFAVRLLNVIVCAARWKLLFKAQGIHFSLSRLVSILLTSRFVGNFVPAGIGASAFRMAETTRLTDRKTKSLVSTSMGIIIGALVSVPISILATLVNWNNSQYATLRWVVLGTSLLFGLGWVVFWYSEPLIIAAIERIHMFNNWSLDSRVRDLYDAVRTYQRPENHGLFIQILLLTVCTKGLTILHTYFDILTFDIHVSANQLTAVFSVWILVKIVPALSNSLGIGDGIRLSIFSLLEISADSALSIALLQRGIALGMDLMGGIVLSIRSITGLFSSKQ